MEARRSFTSKVETLRSSASKTSISLSQTTVYTEGDHWGKARSETTRSPALGTDGNTTFSTVASA